MKCQSKIEVSISNPINGVTYSILIYGKMYECELATDLQSMTFELAKPSYVVTCEDGKSRKYYAEYFIDIVELREEKLKELGI